MKIYNLEVIDRCLYWKEKETLIIGDIHLGYEQSMNERGFAVPRGQFEETLKIFKRIFEKTKKIRRIILLGDVKHYFGRILNQELKDFKELIDFFKNELKDLKNIIITKGNHDKILEPLIKDLEEIELVDGFFEEGFLFFHGDSFSMKKNYETLKNKKIELIILGHFHPAFVLKDKKSIKEEKYKCFLYGFSKEYNKNVIFVPSFFPLIEGSDIINDLEIYEDGMKIALISEEGEVYNFEKMNKINIKK